MTKNWMINKVISKYGENTRMTNYFIELCERTPERFEYIIEKTYMEIMHGVQW